MTEKNHLMRDIKIRLMHLDWLDVLVLTFFIVAVVGAFYLQTLRRP